MRDDRLGSARASDQVVGWRCDVDLHDGAGAGERTLADQADSLQEAGSQAKLTITVTRRSSTHAELVFEHVDREE